MRANEASENDSLLILFIAIALGVCADWFFHGHTPGLSYPIFVILLYTGFFLAGGKKMLPRSPSAWLLAVPVLGLSASFAVFTNDLFRAINYALVPSLFAVHITMLRMSSRHPWCTPGFLRDSLLDMSAVTAGRVPALKPLVLATAGNRKKTLRKVLQGFGLSLPILVLVMPLLITADPVFKDRLEGLFSDVPDLLLSVLVIVGVAVYMFGYLQSRESAPEPGPAGSKTHRAAWHPVTVATVLAVLNAIYLVFVAIQFAYLFGGEQGPLPAGLSFSEYARQGFFQLLGVSVINLSVLLACAAKLGRNGPATLWASRALMILLIACSVVIMFSAHRRLELYEEAYGFTRLRLLSHLFMILLVLLFVTGLVQIFTRRLFMHKASVAMGLTFYLVLNYLNIDAMITTHNLERLENTNEFDIDYHLTDLSSDAVPELVASLDRLEPGMGASVSGGLCAKWFERDQDESWHSLNYHARRATQLAADICEP